MLLTQVQFIHGNLTPKKLFLVDVSHVRHCFGQWILSNQVLVSKVAQTKIITSMKSWSVTWSLNNICTPLPCFNAKCLGWPEKGKPKHYMKSPIAQNKFWHRTHFGQHQASCISCVDQEMVRLSLCTKCSQITGFICTVDYHHLKVSVSSNTAAV